MSNRQKPTTVFYGAEAAPAVQFRVDLALAIGNGTRDAFVAKLQAQLAEMDAARPAVSAPAAPAVSVPVAEPTTPEPVPEPATPEVPLPPAAWYPDPSGQPILRWWDGAAWTEHTAPLPGQAG